MTPPRDAQAGPGHGRGSLPLTPAQSQVRGSPNLPMLTKKLLQLAILAISRPLAQSQGQLQHPWDHPTSRRAPHPSAHAEGGQLARPGPCSAKLG